MAMAISITIQIFAFTVIASTAFHGTVSAQAPEFSPAAAPGPGKAVDCFTTLLNMSDCLSYVSEDSKETKPDKFCCSELAGLVESSPNCLCELLSDPNKVGITIDVKRALKLPSACNVSTPPVTFCSVLGFPVGAGASPSPSAFPPGTQPPDAGDSTTPKDKNGASKMEFFHLGFLLVFLSILI